MRASVHKVRDALATKDIVTSLTGYLVKDGTITASDGRSIACSDFPFDGEFLVPGLEFEKILERMPNDPAIVVEDHYITIKSGRFRGRIQTLPMDAVQYSAPDGKWETPPERLVAALRIIRPFISEDGTHIWSVSVCLCKDYILTTSNVVLAQCGVKGLKGDGQLVPAAVVDFVLQRKEKLSGWQLTDNYVAFQWEDGSWVKSQLIAAKYPESAFKLLENLNKPKWEIKAPWKQAFYMVAGLAEDEIRLYADRITGGRGHAEVEHDAETPVPESNEYSSWSVRHLEPVLDVATHWQPELWPNPATYTGPGIRGLIIGRR